MSAALPSFVELMASLGLSADSDVNVSELNQARTRRSVSSPHPHFYVPPTALSRESDNSPSIIISRVERESLLPKANETRRRASSGNIRAARFSPYAPSSRRGSTSSISDFSSEDELNGSSAPASRRSSCTSIKSAAAPRKKERVPRRGSEQLNIVTSAASCTPISSFARRRSPYSSPTSPSFSTRSRTSPTELLTPVSLPTLPPLIADTFASYSFPQIADGDIIRPSGSPSLSPTSTSVGKDEDRQFMRHHHSGIRISSVCRTGAFQHTGNRRHVPPLA